MPTTKAGEHLFGGGCLSASGDVSNDIQAAQLDYSLLLSTLRRIGVL